MRKVFCWASTKCEVNIQSLRIKQDVHPPVIQISSLRLASHFDHAFAINPFDLHIFGLWYKQCTLQRTPWTTHLQGIGLWTIPYDIQQLLTLMLQMETLFCSAMHRKYLSVGHTSQINPIYFDPIFKVCVSGIICMNQSSHQLVVSASATHPTCIIWTWTVHVNNQSCDQAIKHKSASTSAAENVCRRSNCLSK